MTPSEQTRSELSALRQGVELPPDHLQFMVRWIAFNQAYNELRFDEEETYRVVRVTWPYLVQTNHDLKVVTTSINILNPIFGWLN